MPLKVKSQNNAVGKNDNGFVLTWKTLILSIVNTLKIFVYPTIFMIDLFKTSIMIVKPYTVISSETLFKKNADNIQHPTLFTGWKNIDKSSCKIQLNKNKFKPSKRK